MKKFSKIQNIKGKIVGVKSDGSHFIDSASGEIILLADILHQIYEDDVFDICTNSKLDTELDFES